MQNETTIDWPKLGRYFTGECSPEEVAAIETWASSSPERQAELSTLRRWWESAATLPRTSRVDTMWYSLSHRMHGEEEIRLVPQENTKRQTSRTVSLPFPQQSSRRRFITGALAAALVLTAGITLWRRTDLHKSPAEYASTERSYVTKPGERASLSLEDGSHVDLGVASSLRVRMGDRGLREIFLEGEAIFDVVHNPNRPFIVHTSGAVTEDIGTKFVVRAYQNDTHAQVMVVSGKVALRPIAQKLGESSKSVVLSAGDLARFDSTGSIAVMSAVDTTAYLAWTKGRFAFHAATLGDVVTQLERWYDVTVVLPDSALAREPVTVDMPAQTLNDVLNAVTIPLGLRYRQSGKTVTVMK